MSDRTAVFTFCAATVLLWGLWGFFGKLALDRGMAPLTVLGIESVTSLGCVVLMLGVARAGFVSGTFRGSWNIFGILSGISLAAGLLCYYLALNRSQASLIVPLTSIYPAVATILGVFILREKLVYTQWLGLILVIAGTMLLLRGAKPIAH